MSDLKFFSPAKINLALCVGKRRRDGYHHVETILHQLPFGDQIEVTFAPDADDDILECNNSAVPTDRQNLLFKAIEVLRQVCTVPPLHLKLHKQIPLGAGLAGGSSNAGTLLSALAKQFAPEMKPETLRTLALQVGADVPFFTQNSPCLFEHEHGLSTLSTETLPTLPHCQLALVWQDFSWDTHTLYDALDNMPHADDNSLTRVVNALRAGDLTVLAAALSNDFTTLALERHPALRSIKERLFDAGALGVNLTGKGPTLYALFPPENDDIKSKLANIGYAHQVLKIESHDDST